MKDPTIWISDYDEFIRSLIEKVDAVSIDLIDSRRMCLKFFDSHSRDACMQILTECMDNMLEIVVTNSPIVDSEEMWEEYSHLLHQDPDQSLLSQDTNSPKEETNFQSVIDDLGIDTEEFWEIFTNFIDISDGSVEGIRWAFEEAVTVYMSGPMTHAIQE
jgi:hypothetical protein